MPVSYRLIYRPTMSGGKFVEMNGALFGNAIVTWRVIFAGKWFLHDDHHVADHHLASCGCYRGTGLLQAMKKSTCWFNSVESTGNQRARRRELSRLLRNHVTIDQKCFPKQTLFVCGTSAWRSSSSPLVWWILTRADRLNCESQAAFPNMVHNIML